MSAIPNAVLGEIITKGRVVDDAGLEHHVHSQIPVQYAEALYRMVLRRKPRTVIEVGMAYGISTLSILTALKELGDDRRLISIDPGQSTTWHGAGKLAVSRSGLGSLHQLMETYDYFALPELLKSGQRIELAYIDGWHTFDFVLLDLFYLDRMLNVGGVMAFNDCGFRSVHRAIKFLLSHRKYREVDAGLRPDYHGRNFVVSTLRRLRGMNVNDRYFEKTGTFEPDHKYYSHF